MKLPIRGAGLDAIIRRGPTAATDSATTEKEHEELGRILKATEEALEQRRQECDRTVAKLRDERVSLRKGADEALAKERAAQKLLRTEMTRLQKIIDDDYPTGAARSLMVDSFAARAKAFEEEENLLDAFHLYRRIIRLDPGHIPSLYALATLYYSVDIEDKAIEVLEAIVELAPEDKRARDTLTALRGEDE